MNRKGQSLYGVILTAIVALIIGFLFLNFLVPSVESMMLNLNCGTSDNPTMSLSDGQKSMCLIGESVNPYFILAVLGVVGALVADKVILGNAITGGA